MSAPVLLVHDLIAFIVGIASAVALVLLAREQRDAVARAALAGIPAIAVSGLDDDLPGAVDAATEWVLALAGSRVVRDMAPGDYLTVSLPRLQPDAILGVRVVARGSVDQMPVFAQDPAQPGTWRIAGARPLSQPSQQPTDRDVFEQGFIAVVPMRADEVHRPWLDQLQPEHLPSWSPGPVQEAGSSASSRE